MKRVTRLLIIMPAFLSFGCTDNINQFNKNKSSESHQFINNIRYCSISLESNNYHISDDNVISVEEGKQNLAYTIKADRDRGYRNLKKEDIREANGQKFTFDEKFQVIHIDEIHDDFNFKIDTERRIETRYSFIGNNCFGKLKDKSEQSYQEVFDINLNYDEEPIFNLKAKDGFSFSKEKLATEYVKIYLDGESASSEHFKFEINQEDNTLANLQLTDIAAETVKVFVTPDGEQPEPSTKATLSFVSNHAKEINYDTNVYSGTFDAPGTVNLTFKADDGFTLPDVKTKKSSYHLYIDKSEIDYTKFDIITNIEQHTIQLLTEVNQCSNILFKFDALPDVSTPYYINFVNDVDAKNMPETAFYKEGEEMVEPKTEPTKKGYTFFFWSECENIKSRQHNPFPGFNNHVKMTKNITLYPYFAENTSGDMRILSDGNFTVKYKGKIVDSIPVPQLDPIELIIEGKEDMTETFYENMIDFDYYVDGEYTKLDYDFYTPDKKLTIRNALPNSFFIVHTKRFNEIDWKFIAEHYKVIDFTKYINIGDEKTTYLDGIPHEIIYTGPYDVTLSSTKEDYRGLSFTFRTVISDKNGEAVRGWMSILNSYLFEKTLYYQIVDILNRTLDPSLLDVIKEVNTTYVNNTVEHLEARLEYTTHDNKFFIPSTQNFSRGGPIKSGMSVLPYYDSDDEEALKNKRKRYDANLNSVDLTVLNACACGQNVQFPFAIRPDGRMGDLFIHEIGYYAVAPIFVI